MSFALTRTGRLTARFFRGDDGLEVDRGCIHLQTSNSSPWITCDSARTRDSLSLICFLARSHISFNRFLDTTQMFTRTKTTNILTDRQLERACHGHGWLLTTAGFLDHVCVPRIDFPGDRWFSGRSLCMYSHHLHVSSNGVSETRLKTRNQWYLRDRRIMISWNEEENVPKASHAKFCIAELTPLRARQVNERMASSVLSFFTSVALVVGALLIFRGLKKE